MYHNQLGSMRTDLEYDAGNPFPEDLVTDIEDIEEKLEIVIRRADKAVQGLLASLAISASVKASSLTAIALWFAPLSLSISLVSIGGNSKFGGSKYWIMASIAVFLLLLVMALANTSDRFMSALGKRRKGRALIKLFKQRWSWGIV